ncbi:DNA repair protein RecO [Shewanella intestini]|uniref:DNA repair protein RecO n=1 Tax=Shewanella intestini TaxID=2017544 RepID=A0ABS5HY04_9GAMM|nr:MULTISPECIES: DNA repair protein RecO [Shewanella]MBR9726652.1 DNA repair protein RecO [Shewanella intestini]MRG34782.1 DNA repair protein RecO [Shewanella sp. XMDDZSB0408]
MQRAYVLHHRPFRESSVIVNLLVDGVGRVDAITRVGNGKRSIKSILQPFQPLLVQFRYQPKSSASGLQTLSQIEPASVALPLQGDSLYSGMYLNELLVRLVKVEHQAESLFVAYHQTLLKLAGEFHPNLLRYFEKQLLQELGALPQLEYDTLGEKIEADSSYLLIAESGFQVVYRGNNQAMNHAKGTLSGAMLLALSQHELLPAHINQAKGLMRNLLAPLLGNKPLLSRKLFRRER